MAVSIVPRFKKADIQRMMQQKKEAVEKVILLRLQRIGETFVKNARDAGTYNDITGNLRSSIGYVVMKNGNQLSSSFPGATKVGKTKSREVIDNVKGNYPSGFVLIVVAGMEYAAAVESRGKDVLTASSIIAANDLKKAISEISKKISKAA